MGSAHDDAELVVLKALRGSGDRRPEGVRPGPRTHDCGRWAAADHVEREHSGRQPHGYMGTAYVKCPVGRLQICYYS